MKRFRQIMHHVFKPHKYIVLASVLVTLFLMLEVFIVMPQEKGTFAYISYLISAYSFIIISVLLWGYLKKHFLQIVSKNKFAKRYIFDLSFRSHLSLYLSLAINFFFMTVNLGTGWYSKSVWFITLAFYYCFLAVMRFLLLRYANKNTFGENIFSEWRYYRFCGIMLLLMNIVLVGVIILVLQQNKGFEYIGMLIYVMAIYAFYSVIISIINVIRFRKQGSPVLSASKVINLVVALVAMFALETAMLSQFDTRHDILFQHTIIAITGIAIWTIIFAVAIFMIVRATLKLRKYLYFPSESK
ncbi:hypothetical protein [Listeria seeligeri]|uniref:hypothetical protein n=2 Tax=Listeria seeligeri TaxID=1640 RepID=UPI0022EBFFF9|nr:hypothetical protein [Listeria seeligeri]